MRIVRKAQERGHANFDWLDSWHTFSFGEYYDPNHMGFRALRVINDDRVAPGGGFPPHAHRDMEIVTYILEGGVSHKDSTGTSSTIRVGDVQRMSAGTGIRHSEFNASTTEPTHFLQIWLMPDKQGMAPGYEEKKFDAASKHNNWRLIAAPDARDGALKISAGAELYASVLDADAAIEHKFAPGQAGWLHVARGKIQVGDLTLSEGDAIAVVDEPQLEIRGVAPDSELVLFDLAP